MLSDYFNLGSNEFDSYLEIEDSEAQKQAENLQNLNYSTTNSFNNENFIEKLSIFEESLPIPFFAEQIDFFIDETSSNVNIQNFMSQSIYSIQSYCDQNEFSEEISMRSQIGEAESNQRLNHYPLKLKKDKSFIVLNRIYENFKKNNFWFRK